MRRLRKVLFIAWLVDSAGLAWLFAYVLLYGSSPDRVTLAGNLGVIFGGLGAILLVPGLQAWWKVRREPYNRFIYSLVCFTGAAAYLLFLLASATAQGSPNAFTEDSMSLVLVIATAVWASRSWSSIKRVEPETNPEFRQKHRAFGLKAGGVITAVLVSALVTGSYLGIRAGHEARLEALLKEIHDLGQDGAPKKQRFMQLARENPASLPEYLQRCAKLEPAINDYEAVERQMDDLLRQTQQEIEELKPKASYASFLPVVTVFRAVLAKDLESAKVYRLEIGYAKQLSTIPSSERVKFYTANIQPVIEEEGKVAKDEIEILKDAKARHIKLPENMYEEAGIK